jgi:CubicO group peptidase (beta-lactamase class C family)
MVRRDLGFAGTVAVELGAASPLAATYGEREAAVRAVAAGVDLLVGVTDARGVARALEAAVHAGRIPPARVDEAVRRVFALKARAEAERPREEGGSGPAAERARAAEQAQAEARRAAGEAAAALQRRALVRLGDPAAALRGCAATVLAVSPRAAPQALAAGLAGRVAGARMLVADTVALRGPLVRDSAAVRTRTPCLLVARFPGAAPVVVERLPGWAPDTARAPADTTRRRMVVAAFAENAVPTPVPAAGVLAWGTGAAAQRAAARALVEEAGEDDARAPALVWPLARELRPVPPESVGMSREALARVDAAVRRGIEEGVFPGAAVAIGRRGGLVLLRGYGRTGAGGPAVDAHRTLYDMASLTKVAGTTPAVMALYDSARVRLDAPVGRYIPGFSGAGKGDVSVRSLLTHTGGLPAGEWLYGSSVSAEQALRQVDRAGLAYAPGTRQVYSDFGMILLAQMVREQADEPIDLLLAQRVYAPLGMQSTMYRPPAALYAETAPGALRSERPYVLRGVVHDGNAFRLDGVAGHAGLFSTAEDLAVYAQTLLNGGAYGPRRIWSRETVRRFTTAQDVPGKRALGWDVPGPRSSAGDYFSARSYGHTGFTGTSLWVDPEKEMFVVILANRTYDNASQAAMAAVRKRVAEAAALAITDTPVRPRPGTAAAAEEERRVRAEARRRERERSRKPKRPPPRRGGRRGE